LAALAHGSPCGSP